MYLRVCASVLVITEGEALRACPGLLYLARLALCFMYLRVCASVLVITQGEALRRLPWAFISRAVGALFYVFAGLCKPYHEVSTTRGSGWVRSPQESPHGCAPTRYRGWY